jgi:hypothetical protein
VAVRLADGLLDGFGRVPGQRDAGGVAHRAGLGDQPVDLVA